MSGVCSTVLLLSIVVPVVHSAEVTPVRRAVGIALSLEKLAINGQALVHACTQRQWTRRLVGVPWASCQTAMSATAPRMSCCSARLSRLQKHRSNVKHNQNCASGGHSVSWIVAGVASSPIARLLSAALLVGNAASQSPSADACPGDELTSSRAETNLCLESSRASSWESTKRPT